MNRSALKEVAGRSKPACVGTERELLAGVSDGPANAWFDRLPDNPDPTQYFASFSQYRYDQFDAQGNRYDEAIDANGHRTDTYKDGQGRVTRTVYDDGSFAETLYGVGDGPVTRSDLTTPPTAAEGWAGVPAGGSETVSIAQRKAGDPVLATYSVYDAAGQLTDVWAPAVPDALNGDAPTRPHWHYAYDAAGNQITQQDPKVHITTFAYDEKGRRVSRTLPQGQRQTWAYDRFGNMVVHKVYDAPTGGSYGSAVSTTIDVYNAASDGHAGRLVAEYRYKSDHAVADPDAVTTATLDATAYDEKTAYTYDDAADPTNNGHLGLGQLSEVDEYTAAGGPGVVHFDRYTYDPLTGQLASIMSNEGTVHYAYDPATDRHVRTWTDHGGVVGNDTVYAYDTQGRLQGRLRGRPQRHAVRHVRRARPRHRLACWLAGTAGRTLGSGRRDVGYVPFSLSPERVPERAKPGRAVVARGGGGRG